MKKPFNRSTLNERRLFLCSPIVLQNRRKNIKNKKIKSKKRLKNQHN
ncbi:hypothetical protein BSMD_034060 [Bacillus subtilis Miyagi-4]|nr:hypothetical protein BSNT_07347 [Bacillus subtilis subsp. natto BEST195]GAK81490.1 hypothetical protein BSMD_034060 [Bacillus subtilis Miyagi-4]